jgi:polyphosphate glucokinase
MTIAGSTTASGTAVEDTLRARADYDPRPMTAKGTAAAGPVTLAIDIGGTGIKAMLVGPDGAAQGERLRVKTPAPATAKAVLGAMEELKPGLGRYDRISVGFPGVVVDGVALNAANLGTQYWKGVDVRSAVEGLFGKPTRAINDADLQGLGLIEGRGVELALTLGTGIGSGLYQDGVLVPNLELGHAPFEKGKTYEQRLGKKAFEKIGKKEWRKRLVRAIDTLRPVFNWRLLHLGGGHTVHLEGFKLPRDVRLGSNMAGLLAGVALWK